MTNLIMKVFILMYIPEVESPEPTTSSVDDGRLIVSDGMAFQLVGQPYITSQHTILHQPYSYADIYRALDHQSLVANHLDTAC